MVLLSEDSVVGWRLTSNVEVSQVGASVTTTSDSPSVGRTTDGGVEALTDVPSLIPVQPPDTQIATVASGIDLSSAIFDVTSCPANTGVRRRVERRIGTISVMRAVEDRRTRG